MARRGKTSTAEDFTDLIAMLPWWVGIALAVVSYFVLHAYATAPLPPAKTAQEVSQLFSSTLLRGLAYGGQYIVPMLCTLGALISALRRRKRKGLVESVTQSKAANALDGMSWRDFELLVGEGFRREGYTVTETGGGGADGGVDLVLGKGGEKFLVQCKQWKAFKVGVSVVRELYGVMAASGAAGGFVVTSGAFTEEAAAFAKGRNIRLVNGPALLQLVRGSSVQAPRPTVAPAREAAATAAAAQTIPECPVCSKAMVRRVAKRGASAGNAFWGCSGYPACKGTRPV